MSRNIQKRQCRRCRTYYYVDMMKVRKNGTHYCKTCSRRNEDIYVDEGVYLAHLSPKTKAKRGIK
jgi:formamidopyrimidine-DNA glycosylase